MTSIQSWLSFLRAILRRYREDHCQESAAALTYTSLFAVVPLMTVSYAILSGVPEFQSVGTELRTLIFNNFVPTSGSEIENYLIQFSSQARKLSSVGVLFLAVTAYLMLKSIEKTFNKIWRSHHNRSGLRTFLMYWAILSLGPILIGLSLATTTYLLSMSFFNDSEFSGSLPIMLSLLPAILSTAIFTLLYTAVPNCYVPLKHAFYGGIFTTILLSSAKAAFTSLVSNTSYQLIYGTFAAIPLFLLWIYLSWLIILFAAQFVYALSYQSRNDSADYPDLLLSMALIRTLYQHQQQGSSFTDKDISHQPWLFEKTSISPQRWQQLRQKLIDSRIIFDTQDSGYVLNVNLHQLTLWQLTEKLPSSLNRENISAICAIKNIDCPWLKTLQQHLQHTTDTLKSELTVNLINLDAEQQRLDK